MTTVHPEYVLAFSRGYAACRAGEKADVPPQEAFREEWLKGYTQALQDGEFNTLSSQDDSEEDS